MSVLRWALAPLCLLITLSTANAQPRILSDEEWREDIATAADQIRKYHPKPFRSLTSEEFDQRVASLVDDLPALSDKDIALRLAALVGALEDGHSRLSLPRTHPALGFSQGHTGPDKPAVNSLSFSSLPVRFYLFEDGLHITQAVRGFEDLIGAKIVKIGNASVEEAIAAVRPILFAENAMGVKLLAADRLALPQVLKHFGLVEDESRVSLTIERDGAPETIELASLSADAEPEIVSSSIAPVLAAPEDGALKWHGHIARTRAWYIRIDEIEAVPELFLSDFMADAFAAARRARARRVIIDLRNNQGGSASANTAIVNSIAGSTYSDYGKLFILVGRETFSAATMLVSDLEQYTNAIFVGEPSSGRPSSYGDPDKSQLPNSGLTLRVSTIYWQSWLAGDFREFVETHIDAPPVAADYFAGRDAALEAALDYTPPRGGIAAQMAELFDQDKLQAGIVRLLGWVNAPLDGPHDAAADLVAYGHRYLDDGALRKGRFMMVMAQEYYSGNADVQSGLGRALELKGDTEDAIRRYEKALELDPDNAIAKEALARLAS